ncbi:MAG TPA: CBS domain-containing protein [Polyangia bacterium]|nr:CBS domain-containing protein [Polyangia bacterium]
MALTVGEIMNHELMWLRAGDAVDVALTAIMGMGLSTAPVLDEARRPIGMVSWRDLLQPNGGASVGACMSRSVEAVHPGDRIEHVAMKLAAGGFHHAPVVDGDGVLIGFVSSLDLLRAFVGQPASHPDTFPHWDEATAAAWSDEHVLNDARLGDAPRGPGVVVYIEGGRGRRESVVAVEQTHDVRARLLDFLSDPDARPELARAFASGNLRYRAAAIADPKHRAEVAARVQQDLEDGWFERFLRR